MARLSELSYPQRKIVLALIRAEEHAKAARAKHQDHESIDPNCYLCEREVVAARGRKR